MNQLLKRIAIIMLCIMPNIAHAAIPLSCYQAWMCPQQAKYAPQGWFIGGAFGLQKVFSWSGSPEVDYSPEQIQIPLSDLRFKPSSGFQLGFLWGYRYKGFRFESDITIRRSPLGEISSIPKVTVTNPRNGVGAPNPAFPGTIETLELKDEGVLSNFAFMLNFFYDFYLERFCLFPFIGIGFGAQATLLSADISDVSDPSIIGPDIDERFFNFAIQFTLGLGYVINDHWEADLAYKYYTAGSDNFSISTVKDHNFNITEGQGVEVDYGIKYDSNSIVLEVRWS